MVILGLPGGTSYLETTYPNAATARDNGAIDGWVKYSDGENTARRLHSSAVQPRSARLRPSSIRGVPHDDNIFPRRRDRFCIPAPDELSVRADHRARDPRPSRENGACGQEGREAADHGVARMLDGSRHQGRPRQGAQEVHVGMQEGRGRQGEVIGATAVLHGVSIGSRLRAGPMTGSADVVNPYRS